MRHAWSFVVSAVAMAVILHLIPFDGERVSLFQLEEKLRPDAELSSVLNQCASLVASDSSPAERFFLKRFSPQPSQSAGPCSVRLKYAETQRFFIRNYGQYALLISSDTGVALIRKTVSVSYPRPLVLLPLALFLLALLFEVRFWGLPLTFTSFLLLLAGGNIYPIQESFVKMVSSFGGSQPLFGLLLLVFWVSCLRSRRAHDERVYSIRLEAGFNRVLSSLVGLWNPVVFTAGAKIFLPFRGAIHRIQGLLDSQLLVTAASLYLLGLDISDPLTSLGESLLLPRYFTFAAVLFLLIRKPQEKKPNARWHRVRLWRGVSFVAFIELLSLQFPLLRTTATLTRAAGALVLSELLFPAGISWKAVFRSFVPWASTVLIATFVTVFGVASGVTQLILVLWEPNIHPTALTLFTFIAGICLGFVTGNPAATFWALYSILIRSMDVALVKAALVDGILVGSLLSPFSLFNLLPSSMFGIRFQELIRFRFTSLALPLGIALVIYAVCAFNSVAILQPVTFVFLFLVTLTFNLSHRHWVWKQS